MYYFDSMVLCIADTKWKSDDHKLVFCNLATSNLYISSAEDVKQIAEIVNSYDDIRHATLADLRSKGAMV